MKLATCLLLLLVAGVKAQTISPIVVECGLKSSGEFTVTNNSVQPTIVVLNTYSFKVEDGKRIELPLSDQARVDLDKTSARVSPLGNHVFSYKIFCKVDPCMTLISAGFAVGRTKEGVEVALRLPHVVYSCKKQKGCRAKALGLK